MPLLENARALLEIDRERVKLARETAQIALEHSEVLADAEDRAERLARLGDQERPKALAFLNEAAALVPAPARSTGPGGAGGDGAGRSSAAGGAGSGGGGAITGRAITSRAGDVRSDIWLEAHCPRRPMEIPDPFRLGEFLTIEVWDCVVALGHPDAIFAVPESVAAAFPSRSSSSTGASVGSSPRGTTRQQQGRAGVLGPTGPVSPFRNVGGSSTVGGPDAPAAPTPGERLIERAVTSGLREVVKELKTTGDLGLQIRRNGGL